MFWREKGVLEQSTFRHRSRRLRTSPDSRLVALRGLKKPRRLLNSFRGACNYSAKRPKSIDPALEARRVASANQAKMRLVGFGAAFFFQVRLLEAEYCSYVTSPSEGILRIMEVLLNAKDEVHDINSAQPPPDDCQFHAPCVFPLLKYFSSFMLILSLRAKPQLCRKLFG